MLHMSGPDLMSCEETAAAAPLKLVVREPERENLKEHEPGETLTQTQTKLRLCLPVTPVEDVVGGVRVVDELRGVASPTSTRGSLATIEKHVNDSTGLEEITLDDIGFLPSPQALEMAEMVSGRDPISFSPTAYRNQLSLPQTAPSYNYIQNKRYK